MFHITMGVDDRIHDLQQTADELRFERTQAPDRRFGWPQKLRLRIGTTLLAAGTALVSGVSPSAVSRAGR